MKGRVEARAAVMRTATLLGVLFLLAWQCGFAQAGNAVIRGRVLDRSSGDPIALAMVLLDERVQTLTAADGAFAIDELPPGTYELAVRRLGFEPAHASLKVDDPDAQADLTIWLTPLPLQLDPVTVVGEAASPVLQMQGFYERRALGFGHFLTREDIERRRTNLVRELFQLMPGFRVGRGAGCKSLFLDGLYLGPTDLEMLESLLSVGDIEGIEVYTGPSQMPARFNVPPGRSDVRGGCPGRAGRAVVVWTR